MSGNRQQRLNVTDEAGRARKILAKNAPNKVSGLSKRQTVLTDAAGQIGQHFVVGITHPNGHEQFTVCRPIGYTDLDAERDWVCLPTDQVTPTLTRKDDPSEGDLNQRRAQKRTALAVAKGLLIEKILDDGSRLFFYPSDTKSNRNALLKNATDVLKERRHELQMQLNGASKEEAAFLKQEINNLGDVTSVMTAENAAAERALRKFWASPSVVDSVEQTVPRTYRTLTGPFGNRTQTAINGARGLPLQSLVDVFSRGILSMDVQPLLPTQIVPQQIPSFPSSFQETRSLAPPNPYNKKEEEREREIKESLTPTSDPGKSGFIARQVEKVMSPGKSKETPPRTSGTEKSVPK